LLIIAGVLAITACNGESYTDVEKFAARASLTIDHNIWRYLPDAQSYGFNSIEYYEDGSARVIRADCGFNVGSGIVRRSFLISDQQDYLVRYNNKNYTEFEINEDKTTELWYIDLGEDYEFVPVEENLVDRIRTNAALEKYRDTGDKGYIGM